MRARSAVQPCWPEKLRVAILTGFVALTLAMDIQMAPGREEAGKEPAVEKVTSARLIRRVEAKFPQEARRAGIRRAEVHLQVRIGTDGKLRDISVIECSHPDVGFEEAAMRAVKKWRYEPALADGRPVEVYQAVTIPFALEGEEKT